ncbi:MAG: hypothetical protein DI536_00360 [Archangium gephyra]|uniref:Uncharacterized protein n=1 Tax=Archangium gephyra TaxID=48 RepID=A0A2W5W5A3_9BACT|nr:MAG: hypothetical protein DI536_00360 [Archangium gephyra]
MKSDRRWLLALIIAVTVAATAAVFVLRADGTALIPEPDALVPQKEAAARSTDSNCVAVERFVVRGGEPLTGSLHVMKKLCTAKLTAVLVDGSGPGGERAHLEQKLDLALSGDDLVELRDDEAHDTLAGWVWSVELQFETTRSPALRSAFCSTGAAGPLGLTCNALSVVTE